MLRRASALGRIRSIQSLGSELLSERAIKVTPLRKLSTAKLESRRYLHSRSPCKAAPIQRLLRVVAGLSCEPNWELETTLIPNDSHYSSMYSASSTSAGRIHLPEAWDLSTGSSSVLVGIIDTGIDYTHPDLAANIWTNPGEVAANGVDDDGNGFVDDVHGIDTLNSDSDPADDNSHGTHVAGTIGAVGNNARGVVGISWNVRMIACKSFNANGAGSVAAVVSCINYLVKLKQQLGFNIVAINNSYGGFPYSTATFNAITSSREANIVFVAGAGNNASDNDALPFYPASYEIDNVIAVAASDSSANKAGFSNYGASSVDIAAPGVSILSTVTGSNQYAYYQGTSMATPHVTGAVGLLMAYRPSYNYAQSKLALLSTGTSLSTLQGTCVTGALLNVAAALEFSAPPATTPTPTPTEQPQPSPSASVPSEDPGLDLTSAKLEITATSMRSKAALSCELSAQNAGQYQSLPNRTVALVIQGLRQRPQATTNQEGQANFLIRAPKRPKYRARCKARLIVPDTGTPIVVQSRSAVLRRRP
jgi:subtilisin family serine protease